MELVGYAAAAATPYNLLLAFIGVTAGVVLGALPGISSTFAVAVLLPTTFTMEPVSALIFLGAVYTGSTYGGAYSAILVNTPGTPQNIATTFDGYPMARRGDGNLAITLACLASVVGGLVGAVALWAVAPPLARVALAFGPIEYFWLAVLGLTMIASLSEGNLVKGAISGCLGLALSLVGVSVVSGDTRFAFSSPALVGGINLVPAVIGLLCIPVLIDLVAVPQPHLKQEGTVGGYRLREALRICRRGWVTLTRGSLIGTGIGVLPAAGGSIASLVSYSETRRASRRPEAFGSGEPEGVLASESANNATVGGGLIPTFVLGIPGTPADAVILGALLIHGVRTGPSLFTERAPLIYTFIFGLLIATILMLPVGLLMGRYAYGAIVSVPKTFLVPLVAFFTIIGSFAIHNDVNDVVAMLVLGLFGWLIGRVGIPAAPMVLGLLLGPIAEQGFGQGVIIGTATGSVWAQFFGRPIALAILALIVATLFAPYLLRRYTRRIAA
ncbi:MAG TPA: tripartite tricarboxylate transporter permease [Burkholderiales bacterium]|nr:tripartite tricarboxylate transporter permease [Burkholderiales bacterium]